MPFIKALNVPELLGLAPIAQVSDEDIWNHLVTPTVKGLLGPIISSEGPRLIETVEGLFPGDKSSNLNRHQLMDSSGKLVETLLRFPYVHHLYRTANGVMVIKRDFVKVQVLAWFGEVEKGKAELIFKAALRDRRFDGTRRADDCSLLDYSYANPHLNKRISTELSSVELSIYGFMPGSRVLDATGDEEYDRFINNPFKFLSDPDRFLTLFQRGFHSKRGPGQLMAAIPDVSRFCLAGFEYLARKQGYDLIEMAASHYHVARWAVSGGYDYASSAQKQAVDYLAAGLEYIRHNGTPLTRAQQSWVCVLQSLRPIARIPEALRFITPENGHLTWPQDNVSDRSLWMYKTLSERARGFRPMISFEPPAN